MKLTGYITLAVWATAMAGTAYIAVVSSQGARTELGRLLSSAPQVQAIPAQTEFIPSSGTLSDDLRDRLSNGLSSLQTTLQSYAIKLATSAAANAAGVDPSINQ